MKNKIILGLILFLGFMLRFWHLGINPPSLDWDEASLGYNAYSILQTGKDEYGNLLPLSIRSFGDYKPPLYTYLTVIPVAVFGLTEFSTRFISAFFGFMTVLAGYMLVKELFPNKSCRFFYFFTFLFAISPWHIQFSRVAFEANLGLFFVICGIWLFIKGVRQKGLFFFALLSFILSMYSYHSPRIIAPLILLGLVVLYRHGIKDRIRELLIVSIFSLVLISPLIYQFSSSTGARFGSVTIMNPFERLGSSIEAIEFDEQKGDLLGRLMHNRRIIYGKEMLAGYLDHFNFDFLFLTGDAPARHHAVGMGMLYLFELPFIIVGILYLLKDLSKNNIFIIWWFFLAPIASSLTTGTPHAVRAIYYLPLYQLFAALGIIEFIKYINIRFPKRKKELIVFTFAFLILNLYYYLHMYWIHSPLEVSDSWQYGYKQLVEKIQKYENNYNKIIVTYRYDQPYVYFLFYKKIDPWWYQRNWGSGEIKRALRSFGKYEFRNVDWDKDSQLSNVLLIGTPGEIPQGVEGIIDEVKFLDGNIAFRIVGR